MLRWDELTHKSVALYRFRQRFAMRPFKRLAKRTKWFDSRGFTRFSGLLNEMWGRSLAGLRVLEIGCGPGDFAKDACGVFQARTYAGVDAAVGMARDARLAFPLFSFVAARVENLPFSDGAWDVVICRYLLHHVRPEHRESAIREMHRVASKAVIVQDVYGFSGGPLRRPYEIYYRVADGSYYRPTRTEWPELFGRCGLKVTETQDCGESTLVYRVGYWVLGATGDRK